MRDKKNKYSNSCVVRKKISEWNKNHNPPPFKLNGRSLSEIHNKINITNFCPIRKMLELHYIGLYVTKNIKFFW